MKVTVRIRLKMFAMWGIQPDSVLPKASCNPEADAVWTPTLPFRVRRTCFQLTAEKNRLDSSDSDLLPCWA